jgi:hypothetical protein
MAGRLIVTTLNDDTGVLATQNGMTGVCKAWVNFNGTGTVAIRSSFNVSSITDNGTGDYTVNFTTAMPNANYAVCGCTSRPTIGDPAPIFGLTGANPTTSAVRVQAANTANVREDALFVSVAVFSS